MLYSKIKVKYYNSKCVFSDQMLHGTKYPNTLHVFVKRAIDKLGFLGVEVVWSMDEFFINFYCAGKSVLVPKGTKRVGSAQKLGNEKEGCTVVTTMMPEDSSVLKPTIMFTGIIHLHSYSLHKTNLLLSGTFGAWLMKK